MILTSTTLCLACSKFAALSSNQANLSTADFLQIANLIVSSLTSQILSAREEYLIYQESLPVVAGTDSYRIPYRAVNSEVRHLWFEDNDLNRTRIYRKQMEDIEDYSSTSSGPPTGFYVMGNHIKLLPSPSIAGTLHIAYPFRPNLLVDTVGTQTVLTKSTSSLTVANMPTTFTNGALYDIIDHSSGNGIVYYDLVGSISGTTLSFPTAIPNAAVGNYIALANQSPVPMIPEEGHSLLLEMAVLRVEMIRGNTARVKNSSSMVQDARKSWEGLLENRIVSKAHVAGSGGAQFPLRPW